MMVVYTEDGYRIALNHTGEFGIKPTLSMKKDIETLTGENSVEILF